MCGLTYTSCRSRILQYPWGCRMVRDVVCHIESIVLEWHLGQDLTWQLQREGCCLDKNTLHSSQEYLV